MIEATSQDAGKSQELNLSSETAESDNQYTSTPTINEPLPPAIPQSNRNTPPTLTPTNILALQRTIGNKAVQRLIERQRANNSASNKKIVPTLQRSETTANLEKPLWSRPQGAVVNRAVIQRAATMESLRNAWGLMDAEVTSQTPDANKNSPGVSFIALFNRLLTRSDHRVNDGTPEGFTLNDLSQLMEKEAGENFLTENWRDVHRAPIHEDQTVQGKHEWIITSMVPYIIYTLYKYHANKDLSGWMIAADIIRTKTQDVIFHPQIDDDMIEKAKKDPSKARASKLGDWDAHSAAMSTYSGKVLQSGSTAFHVGNDAGSLKSILKAHLNSTTNDLQGVMNALLKKQEEVVWDGTIPGLDPALAAQIPADLYAGIKNKQHKRPTFQTEEQREKDEGYKLSHMQDYFAQITPQNLQLSTNTINAVIQSTTPSTMGSFSLWGGPVGEVYTVDPDDNKSIEDYDEEWDKNGYDPNDDEEFEVEDSTPIGEYLPSTRPVPVPLPVPVVTPLSTYQSEEEKYIIKIQEECKTLLQKAWEREFEKLKLDPSRNNLPGFQILQKEYQTLVDKANVLFAKFKQDVIQYQATYSSGRLKFTTRETLLAYEKEYQVAVTKLADTLLVNIKALAGYTV